MPHRVIFNGIEDDMSLVVVATAGDRTRINNLDSGYCQKSGENYVVSSGTKFRYVCSIE